MSFRDIYGHEKIKEILGKTLLQKRTGHAYLFSGIVGIGKKTLAREFVKAVNCEKPGVSGDACDECVSCRKITKNIHPDIFFIEPEGRHIRIHTIREVQERMTCKPLEARIRAFLIDDADKMREEVANALLKMLEEPSPSNIFILVTARPSSLLQTITSRCQQVRFNPLPQAVVTKFLEERKGMDHQKALLLSALAGGSVGDALALDQEDIFQYRDELIKTLSLTHREDIFSMLNLASYLGQGKKEIRQGLDILKNFFRDILIFKETGNYLLLINPDKSALIESFSRRLNGEHILHNMAAIERAGEILDRNVNKLLTLETLAFHLKY